MPDHSSEIAARFFDGLSKVHALGAGTPETAYYPALAQLFSEVGLTVKPNVLCLSQLANTGAGSPDFGLYVQNQLQKGEPNAGQKPERGVIEVKPVEDNSLFKSTPAQITKYFGAYRLVIVTNLRTFQIIGESETSQPVRLESFTLAETSKEFWELVSNPQSASKKCGDQFIEFVRRAMTQTVSLSQPQDVAWFLASYARDALGRVKAAGELPALSTVRSALEASLGIEFDEKQGAHFFQSTLVQTLFYGIFSAWVIWARSNEKSKKFDWKSAGWHLRVPFVSTLFQQLASPLQLEPLGLTEVLDWVGNTLGRIKADEFLKRFNSGEAVQYFYEPFLEAFDPELQKQFGVWYTPTEVVSYIVARVDKTLKDEFGLTDGLAASNVYVLDPCCGTGGFLVEVMRQIKINLSTHGLGDTLADALKEIAATRVIGFEIMPAPFVISHLQVGLALSAMGSEFKTGERPAVYLTNALTGWDPHTNKPLPFKELEDERAAADSIKQSKPILVILGNPPYDGFAGVAPGAEERSLTTAYRNVKAVDPPQGQGLNEPYVRFFRMAERRIAEKTGEGIVSFITNYSWLDGLSFTGMRERFLEAFDIIRIDCLNGDKFKTGKTAPDGSPDPSIFSTSHNPAGIQVGTAVATMVRKQAHEPTVAVQFRNLWGNAKRELLLKSANEDPAAIYESVVPSLPLRLQFLPAIVGAGYVNWPKLPELFPISYPGVKTSRDEFLVALDQVELKDRIADYFNPAIEHSKLAEMYGAVMTPNKRYSPIESRKALLKRGNTDGAILRYAYRPFDVRWLYWDPDTKLLDEKREEYIPNVATDNPAIVTQQKPRGAWQSSQTITSAGCLDLIDRGATVFPLNIWDVSTSAFRPNLAKSLLSWLTDLGLGADDLFYHVTATLHAPSYAISNAGALTIDWPRIPVPSDPAVFKRSSQLGAILAKLLDPEMTVQGVSAGSLKLGLACLGVPKGTNFTISAGWGHNQTGRTGNKIVMPGSGGTDVRPWTPSESAELEHMASRHEIPLFALLASIGEEAVDVKMNSFSKWIAVPRRVWEYELGGYPVLKKWLSYRDEDVLHRPLSAPEVRYFSEMVRRISEILAMGTALDASYEATKDTAATWIDGKVKTAS